MLNHQEVYNLTIIYGINHHLWDLVGQWGRYILPHILQRNSEDIPFFRIIGQLFPKYSFNNLNW